MKKFVTMSAIAAVLSFAAVVEASAWTRNGTVSGPRGTANINASGNCANGTCSRNITRTGPYGYSMSRQGQVSCANGTCTSTRTTTGPGGKSITGYGTVSR